MSQKRATPSLEEVIRGTVKEADHLHSKRMNGGHESELETVQNQKIAIEVAPQEVARSIVHSSLRFVSAIEKLHKFISDNDRNLLREHAQARKETLDHGSKLVGAIKTFVRVRGVDAFTYLENAQEDLNQSATDTGHDYTNVTDTAHEVVMGVAEEAFDTMLAMGEFVVNAELTDDIT